MRTNKKLQFALLTIAGAFAIGFIAFVVSPLAKNQVPPSFNNARMTAGVLAQEVVAILDDVSESIARLQEEEQKGGSKALELVLQEIQNTDVARERAVALAGELEKMALAIPEISPDAARQTAVVAISSEAALINKLISYNNNLQKLLTLLKKKYTGNMLDHAEINEVIDAMNTDAQKINEFNEQFIGLLGKFDSYYLDEE